MKSEEIGDATVTRVITDKDYKPAFEVTHSDGSTEIITVEQAIDDGTIDELSRKVVPNKKV